MKAISSIVVISVFLFVSEVSGQISSKLKQVYQAADSISAVTHKTDQLPLIGVSASRTERGGLSLSSAYTDAVLKSGGLPVVIPVTTDPAALTAIVVRLDGLILTGGADVEPPYYNEEIHNETVYTDSIRDVYELTLARLASNRNIPILGICRGEQLLNVAFGGTLYQDLPSQTESNTLHKQDEDGGVPTHSVGLFEGTVFKDIMKGADSLAVNTFHHQAVKDVAPGFRPVAYSSADSIIEGIEALPNRCILGVQWHPEALYAGGAEQMLSPFKFLIGKAIVFKKAKSLHEHILSLDTHCDTPLHFRRPTFTIGSRDSNLVNLPKMEEGKLDAIYMAAFIGQGKRDDTSLNEAVDRTQKLIDGIYQQAADNSAFCGIARTEDDLIRLKKEGKKALFIGIENGYAIGKDLDNLSMFKNRGVTYITLCHSKNNDICDSSSDKDGTEWNGLSPFGKKVVARMNRLGLLIDISHAHEKTFWDVIKLSKQPIVATHSSSYALRDHDRNLTDDQLRAIAKNGGVVQVCPLSIYINADRKNASLTDFLNHIDHIVKVAGIDHTGIGSDFDGGGGLIGLNGANDLINITTGLIERGYSDSDIEKIWGANFLRVLSEVQQ